MRLTIDVTQEDIDQGEVGSCGKCPVALATIRSFEAAGHRLDWEGDDEDYPVSVSAPLVLAYLETGGWYEADPPPAAYLFIGDFDRGRKVDPFSFEAEFELVLPDADDADLAAMLDEDY
jgi:hypothetical protein